jgi:hypothetical protein
LKIIFLHGQKYLSFHSWVGGGTNCIASNYWKSFTFIIIRTGFTLLGEPVSLVKVFRLFKLEQNVVFGVESVDIVGRSCTTSYSLVGG